MYSEHPITNDNNAELPPLNELGLLDLTVVNSVDYRRSLRGKRIILPPLQGNLPDGPPSSSSGLPESPQTRDSSRESDGGGEARAIDKREGREAQRGTPSMLPSQQTAKLNNPTLGSGLDASPEATAVGISDVEARKDDESSTLIPGIDSQVAQRREGRGEGSRGTTRRYRYHSYSYDADGKRTEWIS
jgi:hypothetical protein